MTEVLALIPARGGSKGIPRKNVRLMGGVPLIAHSIAHALQSEFVTRVLVSTDDREIEQVAKRYGAEVPFVRPAEFATDSATDLDVFRHALNWLWDTEQYVPEVIVQLRPTSPVRRVELLDQAIRMMLERPDADSLKSVSIADPSPYKMWEIVDGELEPLLSLPGVREAHSMPRQSLPLVHVGNGYVDIIRPRTVLELDSMVGATVLPFLVEETTYDLDYPEQIEGIERALAELGTAAWPLPIGPSPLAIS